MANLTVQSLSGLAAPTLAAATTSDTVVADPRVRVKVAVGGTATTVTITPSGPYIKAAPARTLGTSVSNTTFDVPVWDYPGHPGSPTYGLAVVGLSQATGVTSGAYVVEGR